MKSKKNKKIQPNKGINVERKLIRIDLERELKDRACF